MESMDALRRRGLPLRAEMEGAWLPSDLGGGIMVFVYDIGDVVGLAGLILAAAGFGYLKVSSALRARCSRRRA